MKRLKIPGLTLSSSVQHALVIGGAIVIVLILQPIVTAVTGGADITARAVLVALIRAIVSGVGAYVIAWLLHYVTTNDPTPPPPPVVPVGTKKKS